MWKKVLWSAAFLGIAGFVWATVTPSSSDFVDYCTGANNSNCVFQVTSGGNVTAAGNVTAQGTLATTGASTFTGNVTHTGATIYTPTSVVAITSVTTISPTSTYLIVASTASNATVTCGASTFGALGSTSAAPCISTSAATAGQYLVITATQTNATVTFSSGTASGMDLGAATRVIGTNKTLSLIFNGTTSVWTEVGYGNN